MLFVHWPLAPEAVHHLFPAGTRPDTFDGETFVGVVGFAVPSTRMGGVAGVGSMNQLNLRLYSVDDDGRQGVVFLSMDVTRPDMVLAARLLPRLPYRWSQLERTRRGPAVTGFQLRRRFPSRLVARVEADIDEAVEHPSDLEVFLTSRWGLHTRTMLGTTWIPIGHAPFPLHRARVRHVDDVLLSAAGVPKAAEDPMGVLWSPGLSAQIGRPTLLDKAHDRLAGNRLG
jgi:uncharacterized protein YqjF (DUF2071 family)